MVSSNAALASQPLASAALPSRVRLTLQRRFTSPDQRGGSVEMWSNVAVLWAQPGDAPPADVWPVAEGEFGRWLLCDAHDGVRRGFRAWIDGELLQVDQVCYVELPVRQLWLRLVRAEH